MREYAVQHPKSEVASLPPVALSIAGSDSGAGAGIQADLKTFSACGVYGLTALTMVTAQSTSAVEEVRVLEPELLLAQLHCLVSDFNIRAAKTGALGSPGNVKAVAAFLSSRPGWRLVVDPVTISKHGYPLADRPTILSLKSSLLPLAEVVTPNLHEAASLCESGPLVTRAEVEQAARKILSMGCRLVVLKGGHRQDDASDFVATNSHSEWLEAERLATPHTHGTGCTYSAAITAHLAMGTDPLEAVHQAKLYITSALANSHPIGRGISPVNHFWRSDPGFGLSR